MKKLGIVGGTAWVSTVEYYRALCRLSEQRHRELAGLGVAAAPEMAIESLDLRTALSYLGTIGNDDSWRRFDAYHRDALLRVQQSGAQVALLASNTPHFRFEAITRGIAIPVISIFDAVAAECVRLGVREVLILGTRLTVNGGALARSLAESGVASFTAESEALEDSFALIERLQRGERVDGASRVHEIVSSALAGRAIETIGVCLCCTELPLAFESQRYERSFVDRGRLFVNSTAAHVDAAFRSIL